MTDVPVWKPALLVTAVGATLAGLPAPAQERDRPPAIWDEDDRFVMDASATYDGPVHAVSRAS